MKIILLPALFLSCAAAAAAQDQQVGARTKAILYQGTRPGEPLNLALRLIMQFKQFPAEMVHRGWGADVYGAPEGMGIDGAADIAAAVLDQIGIGSADELDGEPGASGARAPGLSGAISIGGAEMALPLAEVRLLAPLPRPASLRDFYAFEQHVETAYRARGRPVPPAR